MTFKIRRMNQSDIDNVYAIEMSVHITPWSKSALSDCVLVGYSCFVLETEIEGYWIVGGYVICRHNSSTSHILNFCIAKHLQLQGYGRKFLVQVLNFLVQADGIDQVILEVRPSNSIALHLYKTLGFHPIEIKKGYYTDHNSVEDAILLKKILLTNS